MWNIQPVNSWVKAVQESNTEFANTNTEFAIHFTFALVTDTDLPMEISNFTCKIAASLVRELQCILFSCKDYILDICSKKSWYIYAVKKKKIKIMYTCMTWSLITEAVFKWLGSPLDEITWPAKYYTLRNKSYRSYYWGGTLSKVINMYL